MTGKEWAAVEQYLDASWPRAPLTDAVAAAYRAELDALTPDAALAAIRTAALRGNPAFRPSPLEIVAAVAVECVSIDEALSLFGRALQRGRDAGLAWLVGESPAVALFVMDVGWESLRFERTDDPEHGALVRSRLAARLAESARDAAVDPGRVFRQLERESSGRALRPAGGALERFRAQRERLALIDGGAS